MDQNGRDPNIRLGHGLDPLIELFAPDGSRLFSGGRDATIHIWDPDDGTELLELSGHSDYVYSLDISADGSVLVSGSGDATVRLWESEPVAAF